MPRPRTALLSFALMAILVQVSGAYSVLTHEQMIEARYPDLTPE
jgi:hypothetical protein